MAMITKAAILSLLETSQAAVERAIIVLQGRQTADERIAGTTKHVNGRGWSAFHAGFMSEMFDWIMVGTTPKGQTYTTAKGETKRGYGKALGTTLTGGQLSACRKILMGKDQKGGYVGQLLEEAQAKAGEVAPPVEAPQVSPMLALVVAVVRDHNEGMAPEAIASYLTAHGWRVEQPQEQPQEPAEIAADLTLDPEPEPPAAIAYAAATQPATAPTGEGVFDDPGF